MENRLTALSVGKDTHPKLYFFARHHPEILQVFHNVENDLSLTSGITLADSDSEDIIRLYVESLHIPLLLESKAIVKNEETQCGYSPLVAGLQFRHYDSAFSAKIAANRATAIAKLAKRGEKSGDSLYCYYHGAGEDPAHSAAFIEEIKSVIIKYSNNTEKDQTPKSGSKFDFVFSARIDRGD